MPYIKIYEDDATDEEIHEALVKFMETNASFEASSWIINKLPNGSFKSTCCPRCAPTVYTTLEDWQNDYSVYPDQEQWVGD